MNVEGEEYYIHSQHSASKSHVYPKPLQSPLLRNYLEADSCLGQSHKPASQADC